jgi:hypothetical protein
VRPFRRRAARMARPARVLIRWRKPCVLARRRVFGWNVRLLTVIGFRRVEAVSTGHIRGCGAWSADRAGARTGRDRQATLSDETASAPDVRGDADDGGGRCQQAKTAGTASGLRTFGMRGPLIVSGQTAQRYASGPHRVKRRSSSVRLGPLPHPAPLLRSTRRPTPDEWPRSSASDCMPRAGPIASPDCG